MLFDVGWTSTRCHGENRNAKYWNKRLLRRRWQHPKRSWKKVCPSQNNTGLPRKTDEELRRTYGEQKAILRRTVVTVVKSIATNLVRMVVYTSRDIWKRCLKEISLLNYFSRQLQQNWTACCEQSTGSSTDIGVRKYVVRTDTCSVIGVGSYKR